MTWTEDQVKTSEEFAEKRVGWQNIPIGLIGRHTKETYDMAKNPATLCEMGDLRSSSKLLAILKEYPKRHLPRCVD